MNTSRSEQLYKTACGFMPGGVNSPVRACKAVGTVPLFIDHAKGSRIWDEDGNEFIDYVCSWGPNILGHCCEPVINAVKAACDKGTRSVLPLWHTRETRCAASALLPCPTT